MASYDSVIMAIKLLIIIILFKSNKFLYALVPVLRSNNISSCVCTNLIKMFRAGLGHLGSMSVSRQHQHLWPGLQKPTMYAQKLKFVFLAQLIAVLNSYQYTMPAMARLKWSAFLRGKFTALWGHDRHIGTCGVHQLDAIGLEFYPWPEWCPFGLVVWSGLSVSNSGPRVFTWGALASSLPTPHPFPLPASHPPTP